MKFKKESTAGSRTTCLGISLELAPPHEGPSALSGEALLAPGGSHPIRHSPCPPQQGAR